MTYKPVITIEIPDIDVVVRSEADVREWVKINLSELLISRLLSLKSANDALKEASTRAIIIDAPSIDKRGIGITMGMRSGE